MELVRDGKKVAFSDCPIGLFLSGRELCLMTEYGRDAYIVSSGEFFCGGTTSDAERGKLRVQPMKPVRSKWPRRTNIKCQCDACVARRSYQGE